jgi:hypothetical protein
MATMIGRLALLCLALSSTTALAQPGAEPEAPPPPPPAVEGSVDVRATGSFDVDAALQKLATNAPVLERIAKGTLKRARRAISIGPTVGAWAGYLADPGETETAITFGLGLEVFKIPVLPTPENIKQIAIERAKAKIKAGGIPAAGAGEQFVQEVWDDVVKEILGMEDIRGKTMERPRLSLGLEANRYLDAEAWATRLRLGIGISRVTLAGSFTVAFTDPKTSVFTGVELVTHFLLSKGPRASVVDIFVRGDFEVRNRDLANVDTYVLGTRFLLDAL